MITIPSATRSAPMLGFPTYVDRGCFRFFSGLAPFRPAVPPGPHSLVTLAEHRHQQHAEWAYDELERCTADTDGLHSLVRLHFYQQDKRMFPVLEQARIAKEGDEPAPSCGIGVSLLRDRTDLAWELEGLALSPQGISALGKREKLDVASTGHSASHYSQVVAAGPYFFFAGLIPIDVESGHVIEGYSDLPKEDRFMATGRSHPDSRRGPIVAQSISMYRRFFALLQELQLDRNSIINCTLFLQNPLDTADALRTLLDEFGTQKPAVQVITVDEVGHKGTLLEIECTVAASGQVWWGDPHGDEGIPSLVSTDHIAFVSDQLGLDSGWSFPTDPSAIVDSATADRLRELSKLDGSVPLPDSLLAQLLQAVNNLLAAIDSAPVQRQEIGHVLVQVARPYSVEAVGRVLRMVLGEQQFALTALSVSALGHSPDALVALSATCGRNLVPV